MSSEKTLLGSRGAVEENNAETEVVDGVLIDEVGHAHETTLGPELVALRAWESLELDEFLQRLGFSGSQRRAAACSVINRLVDPVTENRLPLWLQTSSLPDILGEDCLHTGHDKYYKISDLLYEKREEIETYLSEKIGRHFGFQRTFILYDLTNSHFEGECEENAKAKRGRNKQKRHDCKQVVAGVCFDEHGFVLFHKTFAGNMSDSKSLLEMVVQMQSCVEQSDIFSSQSKALVIVDAGIATKENIDLLRGNGFSYLVNETRQSRSKYKKYFEGKEHFFPVTKGDKLLKVKVRALDICDGEAEDEIGEARIVENGKSEANCIASVSSDAEEVNTDDAHTTVTDRSEPLKERLVLCCSEPRSAKEQGIFSNAEKKFLEGLEKLSSRIKTGKLKDATKIERAIGAIQARHTRASKYYVVNYEHPKEESRKNKKAGNKQEQAGTNVGVLVYRRKDQPAQPDIAPDSLLGCYVLRTDRCDLSAQQLWHLYMTLSKAEDGFRALKSECGLRPNHHQLEHRVDAHISISILAYQLQRFILYQLEEHGDHRSWSTLRRVLQTHTYSTIVIPTNTSVTYRIRKPGIPEECQRHIYNLLGVQLRKLPTTKIVIPQKSSTL
ncbi:MAG: transposase [Deltaproteobacteria bacterium]|nr:transposase [Deltaproteobacteria bacterium]